MPVFHPVSPVRPTKDPRVGIIKAAVKATVNTGLAMSADDIYERLAAVVGEELELDRLEKGE